MKKFVFTVKQPGGDETIPVVAKNLASAVAKLSQGGFYSEDDITNIEIVKS